MVNLAFLFLIQIPPFEFVQTRTRTNNLTDMFSVDDDDSSQKFLPLIHLAIAGVVCLWSAIT